MASWGCMVCGKQVAHPADRIEKRLDYRKGQKSARWKNKTVMNLCMECGLEDLTAELERHRK